MPFITVKYGAGSEKLVNPNCQTAVVLSYIKKTCGFSNLTTPIDLATENGEVVDLNSKTKEIAKKYLDDRKTYIPVKVIGEFSEETVPTYVPLLDLPADTKLKFSVPEKIRAAKKKGGIAGSMGITGQDKQESAPVPETKTTTSTLKATSKLPANSRRRGSTNNLSKAD
ncbi:hypothetical protein BCR33DRAFT_717478 [Rhizoclosmatium globosum]|uniref:Uncharacterized protein n=1 Tax=Rhizoclosmatium globosum TaxID=329046 RepID=A0A1Y2C9X8_9FUNG|nr:hypothetical protein HDU99_009503 [Rhizoclosmatium hyalinum]ORY43841.1 hypothetical protein BCR33DRAFT_717478 [Rhizoclosmatium globosum]|eukprot:ORY43841.1 hypothetical protein BCR33DRAFT_717478 [Rhizoclosmatium globosum]